MRHCPAALAVIALLTAPATLRAQADLRPAPSGRATTAVVLSRPAPMGGAAEAGPEYRITIDHGQPHLRGRTLLTDSLVPPGMPWRTGANAATSLSTEVAIDLGGTSLPAGRYILFTLPGHDQWMLLVQRDVGQESSYDAGNDLARIPLRHRTLEAPLESLTFWLIPSTAPGDARGELRFAWGRQELSTDWRVE